MKILKKRLLSLFSGCGGMDIGFEGGFKCLKESVNTEICKDWIEKIDGNWAILKETGFEIVFANDIKKDAKAAWVSYFKHKYENADEIYHTESIVDLVKMHKNGNKIFPNNIDIVIGGFPCQDFSISGKRLGFNSIVGHNGKNIPFDSPTIENRGLLYMWMKEVIEIVKPKVFIAENVKGLVNLKDIKNIIEKDLANAVDDGYIVIPARVLQAANYGVPQSRERIIFYGFKKNALKNDALLKLLNISDNSDYDPYPNPTHDYNIKNNKLKPFVKSKKVFLDLKEPDLSTDASQKVYSKAKLTKGQGNIEINLESVAPTIRAEHHGNIEFRRLNIENGGKYVNEIASGLSQRRLTVRECARLQTFPDNFQFILPKNKDGISVSASSAYKLIGNAVPCMLSYNIAKILSEKWDIYFKSPND